MNPWGYLEGRGSPAPEEYLGAIHGAEVKTFRLKLENLDADTVQLKSAPVAGNLFLIATTRSGVVARFKDDGGAMALSAEAVGRALSWLTKPPMAFEEITREDAYYYGHHGKVSLPAYRAILSDADQTRLYIDATTGAILRVVGADERQWRWLQSGLHDLDFPGLRARPVWDVVVLFLLIGVTGLCATGVWLSVRRVRRDLTGLMDRETRG
jgi:hypothetical protein